MKDETEHFISLAELIEQGISEGKIARAIKAYGVTGWDDFDDECYFEPDAEECKLALDRLKRQVELKKRPEGFDLDPTTDPLYFYGWYPKDLPDFERPDLTRQIAKRKSDLEKVNQNTLMLAGAFAWMLLKRSGCESLPEFKNMSHLISFTDEKFGIRGIGKRTLEDRLPKALALIERPPS